MIVDLLEPKFVHAAAGRMLRLLDLEKAALNQGEADAQDRASETGVDGGDLEEAKEELQGAAREAEILAAGPQNDPVYYPREPILGMLQSSLEKYWFERTDMVLKPSGQGLAPVDAAIGDVRLKPGALDVGSQGLIRAFEQTDMRWASCWLARAVRAFKHKHPFRADPAPPFPIANRARIIVVGDWGTGRSPRSVADSARAGGHRPLPGLAD
jgi:hypothetical protein